MGGETMEIISKRLKSLRESVGLSQNKLAQISGMKQSSINRYENGSATPSPENMVKLADYYDVSLDYIYGRTDNPQGRLYEHKTKYSPEMEKFVEMCFDPNSRANHQLKATLLKLLSSEGVTDD